MRILIYVATIVLSTIILPSRINAQFYKTTRLGFNKSSISNAPTTIAPIGFAPDSRTGISFGQGMKYRISKRWAVQGECLYIFKESAANINYSIPTGLHTEAYAHTERFASRQHYLQLPLVAQFRHQLKRGIMLFTNAGFYSAVKLHENTREPGLKVLDMPDKTNQYFQRADCGGTISIGSALAISDHLGAFAPEIRLTKSFCNNSNFALQKPTIEFSISYVGGFNK